MARCREPKKVLASAFRYVTCKMFLPTHVLLCIPLGSFMRIYFEMFSVHECIQNWRQDCCRSRNTWEIVVPKLHNANELDQTTFPFINSYVFMHPQVLLIHIFTFIMALNHPYLPIVPYLEMSRVVEYRKFYSREENNIVYKYCYFVPIVH